ncbi:hypothetical protein PR202_ga27260 [Eleusine coracana subsp. coracana]|uniref:DEAD-box ATP-dependent RNA helicase 10 n=1 Tax=Eleusine coracana subsp. coracana TaxID=191504 RepID=A0AAV5DGD1_ELECO|nr:hypothetical protein PR202_ga27260 [Eleusine coracana subsp. coracana]
MANGEDVVAGADEKQQEEPAPRLASTFAELGLCPELVEACDAMQWKRPTRIQAETIPHALEGRDLIALAQTGSGKTGAFALPILEALLEKRDTNQSFFACVLSPTRELAIQIAEQFEALGSAIGLRCAVLVGGVDRMQQVLALGKRPHIVVGTPGRLLDHLTDTKGFSLSKIKYLVNKLQRACLRNPVKVEAASKYSTVDTLKQVFYFVPADYKDCYLVHLLNEKQGGMFMIFVRTCESTRLLALLLRNLGFKAISISGQMSQDKRLGALNRFKAKDCNIIICTDVASRGLDIQGVNVVINYDIPMNSKDYVHRVGRTARAGQSGFAASLVNQYEAQWFVQIEKLLGTIDFPSFLVFLLWQVIGILGMPSFRSVSHITNIFAGKKIDQCKVDREEVMILREPISDAKRLALTVHPLQT